MFQKVPGILWEGVNRAVTSLAAVIFAVSLLNPEWGKWLNVNWPNLPRWWAFALLGLLLLYGLLNANYREFQSLSAERDRERERQRSERERLLAEIEVLKRENARPRGPTAISAPKSTRMTVANVDFVNMGDGKGIDAPESTEPIVTNMRFSSAGLPPWPSPKSSRKKRKRKGKRA